MHRLLPAPAHARRPAPLADLAAIRRLHAVYAGGRAVLPAPGSLASSEER